MRYLLPIFILLSYFSLLGQERLTSIVNEVQEEKIYVQAIDGVNYVLKTNPKDELHIYVLGDEFKLEHLYSKMYNNIHSDFFVSVIDEFVYLVDGVQPVKYNFVLNKEVRYTIPDGWFPSHWYNAGTRQPSVNTKDALNNESKSFFLGENGEVIEENDEAFYHNVIANHILKVIYHDNNLSSYFVENIDSGEEIALMSNVSFLDFNIENDGNDLVYVNEENLLIRFDGITGNKSSIPNFIFDDSAYEDFRLLDEYLILLHKDEDKVSIYSSINGDQTHLFDYEDMLFSLTNEIGFAKILDKKLILYSSSDALILDLEDQHISQYYIHQTRYTFNPIIDDRYLIIYYYELVNNEYVLASRLLDISDLSEIDLNFTGRIEMYDYAKVITVADEYVGIFWGFGEYSNIAFRISIEDNAMTHESSIQPATAQGLPDNTTKLLKLGEHIAFVVEDSSDGEADHIYSVEDEQVDLVFADTIYDFYPSGFMELDDKLTFATEKDEHWQIYSFDGKNIEHDATFPIPSSFTGTAGFLENYVLTNKNVFAVIQGFAFPSSTVNLMRYDKIDGSIEELSELDNFLDVPLVTDGKNTYFYSASTLYHVDEQGEMESIYSVDGGDFIDVVLRKSGEHLYFISADGVFLLNGKEALQLYDKKLDISLFTISASGIFGNNEDPLLLDISKDVENIMLYIDGSIVQEVNVGSISNSISFQDGKYFVVVSGPDQFGPRRYNLYDGSKNQLYDLTYLSQGEQILNIHELSGLSYVITYESFTEVLNIYRMSNDFSNADIVFSSPTTSFTADPNFKILDGEGMLYTNNFIFQVDKDYNFYELDVVGNSSTPEMEIDNGYIYFIATDKEYENQLYRIILVSLRLDLNDIESIEVFKVSPNPAYSMITFPIELEGEYTIFDEAGKLMMQGELDHSTLDISKLPLGTHSLQIVNDNKIYISRLVKVDY